MEDPPEPDVLADRTTTTAAPDHSASNDEPIQITVLHNRSKYRFSFSPSATVIEIKEALEPLTHVPIGMQKLIFRGLLSDSTSLGSLQLPARDAKLMLVGTSQSEADELRQVESTPVVEGDKIATVSPVEPNTEWSEQTEHKRILERFGKPDNAMVGILNSEEILAPDESLTGLYDKRGQALRLRVRPDTCELWLATKDVTHKFPLATIYDVVSQPIKDHPEYHIMAFQLGPTPKSRYFVYWLPSQYVDSIKTMVLQYKILRNSDRTQL
ncbi:Ubiquitin domain-containing protein UBFD1 [Fasciola gigantica]|uniref:Ubiquitin domain-containing protein UBFD1 n=1 Tax=Fasciola gigantica TaxID=46835 RepID=A0A504YLH5_FASGI|nr:Ubiquitin domain-containing protein UBFD1 [Fasciola gigantica]